MMGSGRTFVLMYFIAIGQFQEILCQKEFVSFRLLKAFDGQNCPTEYSEKLPDGYNRTKCLLLCTRDTTCRSVFLNSDTLTCTKCSAKYVLLSENTTSNVSMFYKHQDAALAYAAVDERLSWANAKQNCVDLGGQLSSIKSSEEQLVVENIVENYLPGGPWIGGYGTAGNASSFKWLDGTSVDSGYQNWHRSDSVSKIVGEDCMKTGKFLSYKWRNKNCEDIYPSLCQFE